MLFNSYEFIFGFLPIVLVIYFVLIRLKWIKFSMAWLAISSLIFYSWWNIANLPIILGSILLNYLFGAWLTRAKGNRWLLCLAIVSNLLILFYFKYVDFFLDNLNMLLGTERSLLHIVLPLGISFFTFTQITYVVDAYRGHAKEYNFINYVVFVTFFPHLIAGPILHHKEMMPQFASLRNKVWNWANVSQGLFLFSIGLFKKVVLADTLATWANPGFNAVTPSLSMVEAWGSAISYTLQLYFDFSGYTDMAIGIALFFNIRLPHNFNSPYKATSLIDFWRRWHMTLSQFLRDYVYIPLGGNRKGKVRRYLNLLLTMLIGGLWHGAAWTFVFWGFLHGMGLVVNHLWRALGFRLHWTVGRVVTFLFVMVAWVFFRAESFSQAMMIIKSLVNFQYIGISIANATLTIPFGLDKIIWLMIGMIFVMFFRNSMEIDRNSTVGWKTAILVSICFVLSLLMLNRISEFLYFQF